MKFVPFCVNIAAISIAQRRGKARGRRYKKGEKNGIFVLTSGKFVVKYVYETYGDTVWLSLMSQYTPLPQVENISPLNRKTTKREYERLLDYTFSLGVTNAFLQEGPVAEESFIPEFDGRGI